MRTRTNVQSIEKTPDGYGVHAYSGAEAKSFEADLAVHATGCVPTLRALDLEAAGIETESGRLKLNEYLQSTSNSAGLRSR